MENTVNFLNFTKRFQKVLRTINETATDNTQDDRTFIESQGSDEEHKHNFGFNSKIESMKRDMKVRKYC